MAGGVLQPLPSAALVSPQPPAAAASAVTMPAAAAPAPSALPPATPAPAPAATSAGLRHRPSVSANSGGGGHELYERLDRSFLFGSSKSGASAADDSGDHTSPFVDDGMGTYRGRPVQSLYRSSCGSNLDRRLPYFFGLN